MLRMLFYRYMTSKCHSLADLKKLSHFGYRGEALASIRRICAIMEIDSRAKSSTQSYTRIFKAGAALPIIESLAHRACAGTTVTVHDLFSHLPVRRKCLNPSLELEKVRQRVEAIALIHPWVSFSLRNDKTGHKLLQTHRCSSVLGAFTYLFSGSKAQSLCDLEARSVDFQVHGYVGKESHHNKNLQFIYVNGRLVLKTKLHKLINYLLSKSLLGKRSADESPTILKTSDVQRSPPKQTERHGIFVINITCPLTEYDITFDPAKTLVEFKEWSILTACLREAVEGFLVKENLVVKFDSKDSPDANLQGVLQDSSETAGDSQEEEKREEDMSKKEKVSISKYGYGISTWNITNSLQSVAVQRPRSVDTDSDEDEDNGNDKNTEEDPVIIVEGDEDQSPQVVDTPSPPGGALFKAAQHVQLNQTKTSESSNSETEQTASKTKDVESASQSIVGTLDTDNLGKDYSKSSQPVGSKVTESTVETPSVSQMLKQCLDSTQEGDLDSQVIQRDRTFISLSGHDITPVSFRGWTPVAPLAASLSDTQSTAPSQTQTPFFNIRQRLKAEKGSLQSPRSSLERFRRLGNHDEEPAVNKVVKPAGQQDMLKGLKKLREKVTGHSTKTQENLKETTVTGHSNMTQGNQREQKITVHPSMTQDSHKERVKGYNQKMTIMPKCSTVEEPKHEIVSDTADDMTKQVELSVTSTTTKDTNKDAFKIPLHPPDLQTKAQNSESGNQVSLDAAKLEVDQSQPSKVSLSDIASMDVSRLGPSGIKRPGSTSHSVSLAAKLSRLSGTRQQRDPHYDTTIKHCSGNQSFPTQKGRPQPSQTSVQESRRTFMTTESLLQTPQSLGLGHTNSAPCDQTSQQIIQHRSDVVHTHSQTGVHTPYKESYPNLQSLSHQQGHTQEMFKVPECQHQTYQTGDSFMVDRTNNVETQTENITCSSQAPVMPEKYNDTSGNVVDKYEGLSCDKEGNTRTEKLGNVDAGNISNMESEAEKMSTFKFPLTDDNDGTLEEYRMEQFRKPLQVPRLSTSLWHMERKPVMLEETDTDEKIRGIPVKLVGNVNNPKQVCAHANVEYEPVAGPSHTPSETVEQVNIPSASSSLAQYSAQTFGITGIHHLKPWQNQLSVTDESRESTTQKSVESQQNHPASPRAEQGITHKSVALDKSTTQGLSEASKKTVTFSDTSRVVCGDYELEMEPLANLVSSSQLTSTCTDCHGKSGMTSGDKIDKEESKGFLTYCGGMSQGFEVELSSTQGFTVSDMQSDIGTTGPRSTGNDATLTSGTLVASSGKDAMLTSDTTVAKSPENDEKLTSGSTMVRSPGKDTRLTSDTTGSPGNDVRITSATDVVASVVNKETKLIVTGSTTREIECNITETGSSSREPECTTRETGSSSREPECTTRETGSTTIETVMTAITSEESMPSDTRTGDRTMLSDGNSSGTPQPGGSGSTILSDGNSSGTPQPGGSASTILSDGSSSGTPQPGGSGSTILSDGSSSWTPQPGGSGSTTLSDGSSSETHPPGGSGSSTPSDGTVFVGTSWICEVDPTTGSNIIVILHFIESNIIFMIFFNVQ